MSWRVGRKVGRTVYDGDTLIGVMDTPELAARVVTAINAMRPREECANTLGTCHYSTMCHQAQKCLREDIADRRTPAAPLDPPRNVFCANRLHFIGRHEQMSDCLMPRAATPGTAPGEPSEPTACGGHCGKQSCNEPCVLQMGHGGYCSCRARTPRGDE